MALLEARELVKSYRKRVVVDRVTFQVEPAEIVGAGLEIEASGQVRVYVDQIAY